MKDPVSGKSHHRGSLLLAAVVLGAAALAACWLMRGRCPLTACEDRSGEPLGDLSRASVSGPEDEIGVTTEGVGEAQAQPKRIVSLIDIEGIGPGYAAQLEARGLKTTDDLLQAGVHSERP